jgi:hypothetical protein
VRPSGSYTLIEALGSSPVGTVWSATGPRGVTATVAVLDPTVATDPPWREAFAAAATALARPDGSGPTFLAANFSAAAPWAAFEADGGPGAERVFLSLGVDYRTLGGDYQSLGGDHRPAGRGGAAGGRATAAPPRLADETNSWVSRVAAVEPAGANLRRWLWVGVTVAVVLVAVAAVATWRQLPGPGPRAGASPTIAAPVLSSAPLRPGLEPPWPGEWPADWPRFGRGEHIQTLALERLGPVVLPAGWTCALNESGAGFIRYACGGPVEGGRDIGGELVVRDCPAPCDEGRQTSMRRSEEAWGLQWRYAGRNATIADTARLNGAAGQYGIVLIAYFRSAPDGRVDRQLVLRMASPESWLNLIRKVANAIRATAKF